MGEQKIHMPHDHAGYAVRTAPREVQTLEAIGLEGADLVSLLARFDPYGVWKMDLETAKIHCTRDCAGILGTPDGAGLSFNSLIRAFHPEDRATVASCFENAIVNRSGFRFVMRVPKPQSLCKLVKMTGDYHIAPSGSTELFGTLSEFQDRVPTAAYYAPAALSA